MSDDTDPRTESDLRRRAAWLLGVLALVAVLLVVVLGTVLGGNGGHHGSGTGPGPLDTALSQPPSQPAGTRHSTQPSTSTPPSTPAGSSTGLTTGSGVASCPTDQRCALDTDVGNAVAAINAYRTQHGKPAVPGDVSDAAKQCALSNGSDCSGGWAESQVPAPDGTAAVHKIVAFGKLLDPKMTSFGVGWAYDPHGKQYFFAIVRND